jgi:hypothetical protein
VEGADLFKVCVVVIDHVGDNVPRTRFEGTSHLVNRYDGKIPIMGFSGGGRGRIADFLANDAGDDGGSFDNGHVVFLILTVDAVGLVPPDKERMTGGEPYHKIFFARLQNFFLRKSLTASRQISLTDQ